jgi:hypothetical protein
MGYQYKPQVGLPAAVVMGAIAALTTISQHASGTLTVSVLSGAIAGGLAMGLSYYQTVQGQTTQQASNATTQPAQAPTQPSGASS